jgi:hypothetical protein
MKFGKFVLYVFMLYHNKYLFTFFFAQLMFLSLAFNKKKLVFMFYV